MGRVRQVAHPIGLDGGPSISFTLGRPKLMVAGGLAWVKLAAPATIKNPGGDLLSQGPGAPVPSALAGLTAGFGMGPGVSPPLSAAWNHPQS